MNFLANQEMYLRTTEFLKDQIKKKGYNWNTGKMKPMDAELYVNAKVGTSGSVNLLTGSTQEVRGITNFNGNKLVKERVYVANGVAFGSVVADAGANAASVAYNFNTAPDYLRFANLVLKQKDEVVMKLPIGSIINATGRSNDTVYRDLQAFAFIEDESLITYDIEYPEGVEANIPDGQALFVSAKLRGLETFLKR
ncbi:hypothetical protein [Tenacibaculum caenipelagi]|uniref:Uncharacterized protein n=1 Tax=Tenacibaculum caenipelagi TaxID=1325435 RepID=A0A4R6TB76_9FLAO|nr:hypothetical protein [Tenacibaculum caenipelagi]TDQ22754.1 hypothetical protein DFQ07_2772 [Tenacibaculum caenipelagi]